MKQTKAGVLLSNGEWPAAGDAAWNAARAAWDAAGDAARAAQIAHLIEMLEAQP